MKKPGRSLEERAEPPGPEPADGAPAQRRALGSHPEIEEAVRQIRRYTLEQLGELAGIRKTAAEQYIRYHAPLYDVWKENQAMARRLARDEKAQQELREREESRERIRKLMETDRPLAMAQAYLQRRNARLPLKRLVALFRLREEVDAEGRYVSSVEFARRAGIKYASTVLHVFETAGLEPLRPELRGPLRAAALRGFAYGLSADDTAYFLRAEGSQVHNLHQEVDASRAYFTNLRFDSKVYQRRDEGRSLEKIARETSAGLREVEIALRLERRTAPVIICAIRTLYLSKEHELPYVTPALRLPRQ